MQTIRVFISSTFRDMHSERDYLVKFIFPELRHRCMAKGLSIVDVDLRWGVTEEDAEKGMALEICLDEIENCRPFFIGLLGERYGWVPDQYNVPDFPYFDWLKKTEPGNSITALEIYHGVLNSEEMLPRSFFYYRNPDFIKEIPASKTDDVTAESETSAAKLSDLKGLIKGTFEKNGLQGHLTEGYTCKYKGLKVNWAQVKVDLEKELDAGDFLAIEKVAGDDQIVDNIEYSSLTPFQRIIIDKYSVVYLSELEEFGNKVLNDLWLAIEDKFPDKNMVSDPLDADIKAHKNYSAQKSRLFIGRDQIINSILEVFSSRQNSKPLLILGEPGSGKSALMARIIQIVKDKYADSTAVIRFAGVTPGSNNIMSLVKSIISEIIKSCHLGIDERRMNEINELKDINTLRESFSEIILEAGTKGKLFIAIDALNQLSRAFEPVHLTWLPKQLPQNVSFIVSSAGQLFAESARLYDFPVFDVPRIYEDESKNIVNALLAEYRKELNGSQLQVLLKKQDSILPLYLAVACEELRVFPSFEEIDQRIIDLPQSVDKLFEQVLERLELDHDPELVTDALCFIEASLYGLLEIELLSLLKRRGEEHLPAMLWARVKRSISNYLTQPGENGQGFIDFFHQQLSVAVRNRYFKDLESEKLYYQKLADYAMQKTSREFQEYENESVKYKKELEKHGLDNSRIESMRNSSSRTYNRRQKIAELGIHEPILPKLVNSQRYSAIYNYMAGNGEAVKSLFLDCFVSYQKEYLYRSEIIQELFDFVVYGNAFNNEVLLKQVIENLLTNSSKKLSDYFFDKAKQYVDFGYTEWSQYLFEKSGVILEKLINEGPDNVYELKNKLSEIYLFVADYNDSVGCTDESLEYREKAIVFLKSISDDDSDDILYRRNYAITMQVIADQKLSIDDKESALDYYHKSHEIFDDLADQNDIDWVKYDLARSFKKLGYFHRNNGEKEHALDFNKNAVNVLEDIRHLNSNMENDSDFIFEICDAYRTLALTHNALNNHSHALECLAKALPDMVKLVENEPKRTDFSSLLSAVHYAMSIVYSDSGNSERSKECIIEDVKLTQKLLLIEPHRLDRKVDLAQSYWRLSVLYKNEKKMKFLIDAKEILEPFFDTGINDTFFKKTWDRVNDELKKV